MIKFTHIHLLMLKIDLFHQVCCWSHGLRSHLLHTIFIAVVLKWKSSPGCSPFTFFMKSTYYIHDCPWKFPYLDRMDSFSSLNSPHEFSKKQRLEGLPPTSTSTVLWSLPWVQVVDGVMHCISMRWRCRLAKMKRCMELRRVACSFGRWKFFSNNFGDGLSSFLFTVYIYIYIYI